MMATRMRGYNSKYGHKTNNSLLAILRVELCADVIVSAAARRSISVGGGAPPVQKSRRRRRRGAGGQKQFFLRFTKKFRYILKIFLGPFLVIKALRFAYDECYSGQFVRPAKNDGSIDCGVSELQHENKY